MNLGDPFILRSSRADLNEASSRPTLVQPLHDRTQPIGRLRVPWSHIMLEIGWMIDETGLAHMRSD